MATVSTDLIQGSRVRQTPDGWEAVRTFMVSDVTGNANAILYNAATDAGIPDFGDVHPAISGIFVVDIDVQPVTNDDSAALINVFYRKPTPREKAANDDGTPTRSISASLVEKIANKDSTGTLVTLTDGSDVQVAQFGNQIPVIVFIFERRETNFPKTRALSYVGKLNTSTFDGMAAGTCLMTGIQALTTDNGASWDVRYEVTHDPDGWDTDVYYRLPNGLPADGLTVGVGIKTVTVLGSANFSTLNLV